MNAMKLKLLPTTTSPFPTHSTHQLKHLSFSFRIPRLPPKAKHTGAGSLLLTTTTLLSMSDPRHSHCHRQLLPRHRFVTILSNVRENWSFKKPNPYLLSQFYIEYSDKLKGLMSKISSISEILPSQSTQAYPVSLVPYAFYV